MYLHKAWFRRPTKLPLAWALYGPNANIFVFFRALLGIWMGIGSRLWPYQSVGLINHNDAIVVLSDNAGRVKRRIINQFQSHYPKASIHLNLFTIMLFFTNVQIFTLYHDVYLY